MHLMSRAIAQLLILHQTTALRQRKLSWSVQLRESTLEVNSLRFSLQGKINAPLLPDSAADIDPYLEGLIEALDDADRIRDEAFALLFRLHGLTSF